MPSYTKLSLAKPKTILGLAALLVMAFLMLMLGNLSLILLLVILLLQTQIINNTFTTLTLILSTFLSLLLNVCITPGGFAWRNLNNLNKLNPNLVIPGPSGFPILGNLAHRKLATLATSLRATKLMALSLGSTRVVISSHPDTAKEILSGSAFSDRPIKESARLLMFERAIGFAPCGKYWRQLRRIATNHMFSPRRIAGLERVRQCLATQMLAKIGDREMDVVEMRELLQRSSLSNVIESVFGSGLSEKDKEELGLRVSEGYELISKFNLEDYFPVVRFLDVYGVKRKCFKLGCEVERLVGQIVRERKQKYEKSSSSGGGGEDDFLSCLVALPEEEKLSDADMVAVLWEMIFRGTDTIAILLEWIMARMVLHQDVQTKVQLEIHTCLGHNSHVRDSDIARLPYLQAVVKEVLRLHPPGPLLSWARLAIHDTHVAKFFVPAGTTAMVNMWAITHDPSIWKDPWTFNPNRFIQEDVSIMGSDLRFAPFGSGRRVCPGKTMGLATVHLWLARLLHQYKWYPAEPVDLSETLRLSLEMKRPLKCRVSRRSTTLCL